MGIVLSIIGVAFVIGLIVTWFVKGLVNDRKHEIESELKGLKDALEQNRQADNEPHNSKFSKWVLKRFRRR